MSAEYTISPAEDVTSDDLRALLVEFASDEQTHFNHPQRSREDLVEEAAAMRHHFVGENIVFAARDTEGRAIGLAWCALYDPGNGLEGELVELVVEPQWRGRGVAKALAQRVSALFRERGVSFASVWTRPDNPAALAVYQSAGFRPTEQTVLTWLPIDGG
jgi:ribosomal protein S18 acetylase RimI-like enzyme